MITRFIAIFLSIMLLLPTTGLAEINLQTEKGGVSLPKPAQRIVVLEFSLLDDLLQLGVRPVGFASSQENEGGNPPFLLNQIQGMTDVGTRQQPNLEKIIALHPDLIVADVTLQGSIYSQLTKIAPTLMLNGLLGDVHVQIKNLQTLAAATNNQKKVEPITKKLLKQYAETKKIGVAHPSTVMVGYANSAGQFQALTANALTSKILQDFAHPNLMTISRQEQSVPIPLETLMAKNPDSIVMLLTDGDMNPYYALIRNPLWKELRAVKTKHIYFMDRDIWAKNHGVLATEILLQQARNTGFLINKKL